MVLSCDRVRALRGSCLMSGAGWRFSTSTSRVRKEATTANSSKTVTCAGGCACAVADAERSAGVPVDDGDAGRAVVGDHALLGDAVAGVELEPRKPTAVAALSLGRTSA